MDEQTGLVLQAGRISRSVLILKLMSQGLLMTISISQLILGSMYLNDCIAQPKIPVFLIVYGAIGLFLSISHIYLECYKSDYRNNDLYALKSCNPLRNFNTLLHVFLFAWFITGCVWVYAVYKPNMDDVTDQFYCNEIVYSFALWFLNTIFIIAAIIACITAPYVIWRSCFASHYL